MHLIQKPSTLLLNSCSRTHEKPKDGFKLISKEIGALVLEHQCGMTVNFPGHPMSVTQHYFNYE